MERSKAALRLRLCAAALACRLSFRHSSRQYYAAKGFSPQTFLARFWLLSTCGTIRSTSSCGLVGNRYNSAVRRRILRSALLFAAAWVLAAAPSTLGTSVVAPSFETMVERADLIFSGQMIGQRCEWREIAGQRSIVTLVRFNVLAVHKGEPRNGVELQFLGGTVGDVSLDVAEIPKFKRGERVVLFVEGNGVNVSPLVGFYHGRFRVENDASGREVVMDRIGAIRDTAEIGAGAERARMAGRAMSHVDFTSKIREVAARRRKP